MGNNTQMLNECCYCDGWKCCAVYRS